MTTSSSLTVVVLQLVLSGMMFLPEVVRQPDDDTPSDSDFHRDFVCPHGFPAPAMLDPGDDITHVHPAHFRYVAAMGDSITAGFASKTLPLEFRGFSFSGGTGGANQHTLEWFLSHYGSKQKQGGAVGQHLPHTVDSPNPYKYSENDHLNVAVSSASSRDYPMQLERLQNQSLTLGDDGSEWMVVTIFFGANDNLRTTLQLRNTARTRIHCGSV